MADEKTGTEGSNTNNIVPPAGAPSEQGGAPVPSPHKPPVSHLMPHDSIEAGSDTSPITESVLPPIPLTTIRPTPSKKVPAKKAPIVEEELIQRKPAQQAFPAPKSIPSPEHPPVSHIMPHEEIVPTGPLLVPPKPPVANMMPPMPEMKIELDAPLPPIFSEDTPPTSPQTEATPASTGERSPDSETKRTLNDARPSDDAIADSVGLVRPKARARMPDHMGQDMSKILKEIKLPEKRSFSVSGEKISSPSAADQDAQKLDAVLSARITENVAAPVPPQTEATSTVVPDQNVFHEDMHIASVHTLKHDLQHVVQEQKMSVVKAVALEQEKRARMDHSVEPLRPPSRAPSIILTTIVFILLGLGALGAVYYIAILQSAPGPSPTDPSLVFAEQTVAFPLTEDAPQSLRAQLALARTSSGTLGSLMHIIPVVSVPDANGSVVQKPATFGEFFAALGIEPPENLMRALGDDFFLGIHTVDKNAPILVVKVVSYDRAFDGMLSWEKYMNGDLAPFFIAVPRLVMGPDGIQTTRPFSDLVMRNYDVRALKDDDGVIQLYYSFPTRDLLIIAESPYTFTEILSRLQAGRRL